MYFLGVYTQAPQGCRQYASQHLGKEHQLRPLPWLTAVCHHGGQAQAHCQVQVPVVRNPPTASSLTKCKETWTHEFCVLADKDQRQVP